MFNPEICQCKNCDTVLQSKYSGQFVSCECGDSFVDQTEHYSRYGGTVQSIDRLILSDLKRLSGIGYERDDILIMLSEIMEDNISLFYHARSPELGFSFSELVDIGRGHEVVAILNMIRKSV